MSPVVLLGWALTAAKGSWGPNSVGQHLGMPLSLQMEELSDSPGMHLCQWGNQSVPARFPHTDVCLGIPTWGMYLQAGNPGFPYLQRCVPGQGAAA